MITANVLIDETIAALRGGAYDFIGKPINLEELHVALRNGIEAGRLRKEVNLLRRERAQQFSFDQIIGNSPAMREMLTIARKVAESEVSSVLLQGPSGTGKDLVAKAIHYQSHRGDGPFVAINCAALPGTLIESELFGYEKGAFTDAKARKEGLFEQAEGGTLFLDEIGELELSLQAKLLRVLEEGAFRRVGGLRDIPFDARIIAASNRDPQKAIVDGKMREDLYYRLNVFPIDVPPLRERLEDIPLFSHFFLQKLNETEEKKVENIEADFVEALQQYEWPGNVRELRNVINRAFIMARGNSLTVECLPDKLLSARKRRVKNGVTIPLGQPMEEVERIVIEETLAMTDGDRRKTAEILGISYKTLYNKTKKYKAAGGADDDEEEP
jgi:DNA-binding NtrC family response regulator